MCSLPFSLVAQPLCAMPAACTWRLLWQQVSAAYPFSLHLLGLPTAICMRARQTLEQQSLAVQLCWAPLLHVNPVLQQTCAADLRSRPLQMSACSLHRCICDLFHLLQQALAVCANHTCCLLHRHFGSCPLAGRQKIVCTPPFTLGRVEGSSFRLSTLFRHVAACC